MKKLIHLNEAKCIKIYDSLNENEKYGIQFGIFPVSLKELTHDEIVELMEYRKNVNEKDVNKK